MIKTPLEIIKSEKGSIMHVLKNSDQGFSNFGEVYFSTVNQNVVKAWKLHKRMNLNVVVPSGEVLFSFFDVREKSSTVNQIFKLIFSQSSYFRLTVPPGIWFGFKGIGEGLNLICNVSDIVNDPLEILRKEVSEIEMNWDKI